MKVVIEGGPHDGEEYPDVKTGKEYLDAHGERIPIRLKGNGKYVAIWKDRQK